MLRFGLISLFFFFSITTLHAQNNISSFPTPGKIENTGEVLGIIDFISDLFSKLTEKNIIPELSDSVSSTMPYGTKSENSNFLQGSDVLTSPAASPATDCAGPNCEGVSVATQEYCLFDQSEVDSVNPKNFFEELISNIKESLGIEIVDQGNKCAQDTLSAKLPRGIGEEILVRSKKSNEIANSTDPNLLGTAVSNTAMADSYPCLKCGTQPYGTCTCEKSEEIVMTDEMTPTPEVGTLPDEDLSEFAPQYPMPKSKYLDQCVNRLGHGYILSPQTLPSICREKPTSFRDGDRSFSNGTCEVPNKGYCSVDCLLPFFDNDRHSAEKAAMICWRESGGNPNVTNRGCFNGISNEYSVGLFQINLKNEDRNPFSQNPRSYQCWDAVEPTPAIRCGIGSQYDYCTRKFQQPEVNIPEAWNLYFDKEIYHTSNTLEAMCTVFAGGLKNIWSAWSTAGPGDCGIVYERKR